MSTPWAPPVVPVERRRSPFGLVEKYVARSLLHSLQDWKHVWLKCEVVPHVGVRRWIANGEPHGDLMLGVAIPRVEERRQCRTNLRRGERERALEQPNEVAITPQPVALGVSLSEKSDAVAPRPKDVLEARLAERDR